MAYPATVRPFIALADDERRRSNRQNSTFPPCPKSGDRDHSIDDNKTDMVEPWP